MQVGRRCPFAVRQERALELCNLLLPSEPLREQKGHGRAAQQSAVEVENDDGIMAHRASVRSQSSQPPVSHGPAGRGERTG
jgi:hypothetical protein